MSDLKYMYERVAGRGKDSEQNEAVNFFRFGDKNAP